MGRAEEESGGTQEGQGKEPADRTNLVTCESQGAGRKGGVLTSSDVTVHWIWSSCSWWVSCIGQMKSETLGVRGLRNMAKGSGGRGGNVTIFKFGCVCNKRKMDYICGIEKLIFLFMKFLVF